MSPPASWRSCRPHRRASPSGPWPARWPRCRAAEQPAMVRSGFLRAGAVDRRSATRDSLRQPRPGAVEGATRRADRDECDHLAGPADRGSDRHRGGPGDQGSPVLSVDRTAAAGGGGREAVAPAAEEAAEEGAEAEQSPMGALPVDGTDYRLAGGGIQTRRDLRPLSCSLADRASVQGLEVGRRLGTDAGSEGPPGAVRGVRQAVGHGGAALGDAPARWPAVRDQLGADRSANQAAGPEDRRGPERPGRIAPVVGELVGPVEAVAPPWSAEERPQHAATAVRTKDYVCTKARSGLTSFVWGPPPQLFGNSLDGMEIRADVRIAKLATRLRGDSAESIEPVLRRSASARRENRSRRGRPGGQ